MAPQAVLPSSLSLGVSTLGSSTYGFASLASPTSPPAEDAAADGGEVVGDDSMATKTVVLIVLGIGWLSVLMSRTIGAHGRSFSPASLLDTLRPPFLPQIASRTTFEAIFTLTILSLFLFSRPSTLAHRRTRSFPTASFPGPRSLAILSAQVPRLARAASQQVLAPALRNAPFYLPRPSQRPRTAVLPYGYGSAGSASRLFGSPAFAHTRTTGSFESNGSTAAWSDIIPGGAMAYAQPPPPYWTIGAPDAAIPAHACAVPAGIQA